MQIIKYIFFLSKFNKVYTINYMIKSLTFLVCFLALFTANANAAINTLSDFMPADAYANLYPYMTNKMRTALKPSDTTTTLSSTDFSSTINRTINSPVTNRRVVARPATQKSSSSSSRNSAPSVGRAAVKPTKNTQSRRVVSRQSTAANYNARGGSRLESSYIYQPNMGAVETGTGESISSDRCLADYTQCMNEYCERENTEYNRCYCSSKLAQIDAKYQTEINSLIVQILELQGAGAYTAEEMNEYWTQTIGQYTGDNSWTNLENVLDINWTDTESRVRGQQAFLTGHEYCVQNLRGCYYMAANMRDAYRSQISRDCKSYETSLQNIKNVAESIIENYND